MIKRLTLSVLGAAAVLSASFAAQAQSAAPTGTLLTRDSYLIVTHADQRKCFAPTCGGYFYKAVNLATTRCADGTQQKECHGFALDTKALGWTAEQTAAFEAQLATGHALVKGWFETAPLPSNPALSTDVLTVTEAWQGQGVRKPMGTFYGVQNTGIMCITTPCPTLGASKLNTSSPQVYTDLDLSLSGASPKLIQLGLDAAYSKGILAAGYIMKVPVAGPGGAKVRSNVLYATEFYLRAQP